MAKRRMISQELIYDENYNSISIEAQLLFIRMLTISDDCGVIPVSEYTLLALINPPEKIRKNIKTYIDEIINAELGKIVLYNGKKYFLFKKNSFDRFQSYIINKRVTSEYLKITSKEFDDINWDEFNCNSNDNQLNGNCSASAIESNKYKDISNKKKVGRRKKEDYTDEFLNFWNLYPKKTAKKPAFESWLKINPPEQLLFIIMQSLEKHIEVWKDMDSQYIPHGSTWLNQRRWEDEVEIKTNKTKKSKFEWGNDD